MATAVKVADTQPESTTGPAPEEEEKVQTEGAPQEEVEEVVEGEEPQEEVKTVPLRRFNEVYARMKELERTLVQLVGAQQQPQPPPPVEKEQLPDFDSMTPAEVAHWTLKQTQRLVDDAVRRAVQPVVSTVEATRVSREIKEAEAKYPDFWDYREQMIELAQRHPTLTAEEVYHLAKRDEGAVKRSVMKRVKASIEKKKAAKTETRSSPAEKVLESTQYKNVKEAALAQAKKLGLL